MIKQFDWKFSTNKELFADLKVTELPDNKKPMTKMFRYDLEFNEDTHWKLVQLSALKKMHQEDFVEELLTCVMEVLLMDEEKEEKEKDTQANHIEDINKGVAHEAARSREVAELRAELERERIRLAACGVVAKADTPESAKKARDMHPDYHSASLDDVISMVDALMAERARQARSQEVAEPAPVAGGLMERGKLAIDIALYDEDDHQWNESRAAILEVAKWLREQGTPASGWAMRLEQEAER